VVSAIARELSLQKNYLGGEAIKTIYFGGGTPSLLNQKQLDTLFAAIDKNFSIHNEVEVTLEANPDDLTFIKLQELANTPVNRLSIGVQSFDDEVLKFLNRAHGSHEAERSIMEAQDLGFENISLDLIYAIPDRDDNKWKADIEKVLQYAPTHISSYCLTIEPQTVFGKWKDQGRLKTVGDEYAASQFEIMLEKLSNYDYEQYEVSNFCKAGFESKHNSSYWKQEKYLGVGPSAHSYNKINRQFNVSHNKKYLDALSNQQVPFTLDRLSREDHINDYLLTTIRTKWGADLKKLSVEYNYDLARESKSYLELLQKENKAVIVDNKLILTKQGLLFADEIASNLFLIK